MKWLNSRRLASSLAAATVIIDFIARTQSIHFIDVWLRLFAKVQSTRRQLRARCQAGDLDARSRVKVLCCGNAGRSHSVDDDSETCGNVPRSHPVDDDSKTRLLKAFESGGQLRRRRKAKVTHADTVTRKKVAGMDVRDLSELVF